MRAWGFEYKTIGFIWVKLNGLHEVFLGTGNYTRSNSEPCLLGTRGKVSRFVSGDAISSVIVSPRGTHSAKPYEARLRIEKLVPHANRVELFARDLVYGWDGWGDQHPMPIDWIDMPKPLGQMRLV
jgi:N6-adenosine-specific RNA methylase IME4